MDKRKQAGKGLSGFITGILLATAVIAGVIFMLNKSRSNDFKEQETPSSGEVRTEILTPSQDVMPPVKPASSETVIEILPDELMKNGSDNVQEQDKTAQDGNAADNAKETAERPKADTKPMTLPEGKKNDGKKEVKPSPEQILESGNLEKARRVAEAEQQRKAAEQAERRRAEAALSGKVLPKENKAEAASANGGKVLIQAGSYATQADAEAQRTKLAMIGVSARVVQANVNGKTVYRVQTGAMSSEAAAKTRRTLQQNGIDSFAKQVQ